MKLGKQERKALDFALRVFHEKGKDENRSWHSFSKDADTKRAILSLRKKRLVDVNKFGQFRVSIYGRATPYAYKWYQTRANPTSFYESEPPDRREARLKRKSTTHEYIVQGYYSGSWEDVDAHDNRWDAIQSRKNYDENERSVAHRIVRKRIKPVRSNPSRQNTIRVGDMVMGIMGVDGGYVGRVKRISGNVVTFVDIETGKERETTAYNLTKNIPPSGKFPRRNPSRRRLLEIEKELKKRARRMGLTGERARAYIYGTYGRIKRASGY